MKLNKNNKPKLFKDYKSEFRGAADAIVLWSDELCGMIDMLDDLAKQIHELNEKMDWVIKRGVGEVYKMEKGANGTFSKTLSCYLPFKEVKDYFGESLKNEGKDV